MHNYLKSKIQTWPWQPVTYGAVVGARVHLAVGVVREPQPRHQQERKAADHADLEKKGVHLVIVYFW